ncbi:Ubiquinone/menaquinone biosynthesis C-methyltransferase UbiE [Agromyces sp. NDB4Y10]|uniref:SAM-dependent methyltransferase n=1 Tax=Agromyces sp. NDB4Y10 TaxID=1775951 RepID=UPI0007B27D88|nr:class I SAM-dependent methyltransferase [Agromyces sp. NDB4Y10]KZE93305.1 Ubiquinone/menaquinone biosynthesis C-methyltransferase UbiE [Agromyces sp. NDB4Y10]
MGTDAASVPERVRWAVDVLAPQPGERVLDIGSGTGASVGLLLERLAATDATGRPPVVAIDRSATAVARIRERVADAAASVEVVLTPLATLDASLGPFDAAFGVNVNVFWTSAAVAELRALAAAVRPGGRLLIAYGIGPVPLADAGHLDGVEAAIRATPWFSVTDRLAAEHGSGILAERTAAPVAG